MPKLKITKGEESKSSFKKKRDIKERNGNVSGMNILLGKRKRNITGIKKQDLTKNVSKTEKKSIFVHTDTFDGPESVVPKKKRKHFKFTIEGSVDQRHEKQSKTSSDVFLSEVSIYSL